MNRFTEEERKAIFSTFWAVNTWEQKTQYLLDCISLKPVKRTRTKDASKDPKSQYYYHVGAENKEVCRLAFMSLHGIKEGRLKKLTKMKREKVIIAPADGRGKSKFGIIFIDDDIYFLKINLYANLLL